jgi:TldD protein
MRKELAELGLETAAKLGASYADIRFVDGVRRLVNIRNGKPDVISHNSELGYGVRLIVDNGWGFVGSNVVSRDGVKEAVEQAVKIARASARTTRDEIELAPTEAVEDRYESDVKIDPMTVPIEEIFDLLTSADAAFREASRARAPPPRARG